MLLALAVVGHLALLSLGRDDGMVRWDSMPGFLAAAGHEAGYARWEDDRARMGWTRTEEVQSFLHVSEPGAFGVIRDGLAAHDVHPPLYFWCLHLAMLVLGTSAWTTVALHGLVGVGTIFLLYRGAVVVGTARETAAFGTLIWAVSVGAVMTGTVPRPYTLFALLGLAYTVVLARGVREGFTSGGWVKLAVLTSLGVLTHYHFVFFLLGGGAALFVSYGVRTAVGRRVGPSKRDGIGFSLATAAGLALAVLAHPRFPLAFVSLPGILETPTLTGAAYRMAAFPARLVTFAVPWLESTWMRVLYLTLAAGVTVLLLAAFVRSVDSGRLRDLVARRTPPFMLVPLVVFLLQYAAYVGFVSPWWATGRRYAAHFFPFLALGVAVWLVGRCRWGVRLGVTVALIAFSGSWILEVERLENEKAALVAELSGADRAVLTSVLRRDVLRTATMLPPDAVMRIAKGPARRSIFAGEWERGERVLWIEGTEGVVERVTDDPADRARSVSPSFELRRLGIHRGLAFYEVYAPDPPADPGPSRPPADRLTFHSIDRR